MRAPTTPRLTGLLMVLALVLLTVGEAQASHFRFGHLTWESRPEISPTTVDLSLTVAARRSFYSGSASDGRPQVGDTINMISTLRFGDGTTTNPDFEVVASNPEEDWVIGIARTQDGDVIRKTYPAQTDSNGEPWRARISQCCRLHALRNAGGSLRVEARVDLSDGLRSPLSSVSPVVTCQRGTLCQFAVPAVDPDGEGLRWRDALGSESGISSLPSGGGQTLAIDEDTGIITWHTSQQTPLGLYSVPVQIEDLDAEGDVRSSVPLEFIVSIQDFADNAPPVFDVPPSPASGETVSIPRGRTLEFMVQASDADVDDTVVLNNTGLPPGASFDVTPGNPGTGYFNWTPDAGHVGEHLVTFTAIDSRDAAAAPHPVRIEVTEPAIRDVKVTAVVSDDRIEIDPDSFATAPDTINQNAGLTEVVWTWPALTAEAREELDLVVDFLGAEAGERRLLTGSVTLEYLDINGNRVQQTLDAQYVEVLPSVFDVAAKTDRERYGPDDKVDIGATLTNLGRFTTDGELALAVVDEDDIVVSDLGLRPVEELAAGESRSFDDPVFATADVLAGTYVVRAQALGDTGDPVATARAPFVVDTGATDGDSDLSGRVTTDRSVYDVGDVVAIRDLVGNVAPNATAENVQAHTRVRDPEGNIVWAEDDEIAFIAPGAERELTYSLPLGRAAAGGYRVELAVDDAKGRRAAEDVARFNVRSTSESGVGLVGDIQVEPDPVRRTERLDLWARLHNDGNALLEGLPAELLITDGETGEVLADWEFPGTDLGVDEQRVVTREWDAVTEHSGSRFAALLRTTVADEPRPLAQAWFTVTDKLDVTVDRASRGRVLVMVDGPDRAGADGECRNADEIELAVAEPLALDPDDQVRVALYDEAGGLVSARSASVSGFESRWAESGEAGEVLALSHVTRGRVHVALMNLAAENPHGSWRVEVEADGNQGIRRWDSGYFAVDCSGVPAHGYGDLERVAAWAADAADPHGPKDAPTLAHQRRHLEAALRSRGWSYHLAVSADDLERALGSGRFSAYALLHEHEKLPEALQHRLVEAVDAGGGLLVAGRHDQRNGRLDPALGIDFRGRLPHADGVDVDARGEFEGGTAGFLTSAKPLRARLAGAEPAATFTGTHPERGPGGGRGGARHGEEVAIACHAPGAGVSGYMGFDVLAEATLAQGGFFDDVLFKGLEHIATDRDEAGYGPPARMLTIRNLGEGTEGRLLLPAIPGVEVVDPGPGRITGEGGLDLRFDIAEKGTLAFPLWIAVDDHAPETVEATLRIATASGVMVDYTTVTIPLR